MDPDTCFLVPEHKRLTFSATGCYSDCIDEGQRSHIDCVALFCFLRM